MSLDHPDIIGALVLLLVLLGWYLSYTASRLDRLHGRVEGTLAALDAQLVRRAEATVELVGSATLDPASSLLLADTAGTALGYSGEAERDAPGQDPLTFDAARFAQESDLTEALRATLTGESLSRVAADPVGADCLARLQQAGTRMQLARNFHNSAVTDVRRVRRQWAVRVFRLAGHAPMPRSVDFDDRAPFDGPVETLS